MEIKNYKKGDEYLIIEMFELVFKQKMSLEQWQWRFAKNPAGNHQIKLMWDGNKLIGHYAVSPIKIMVNGELTLTAHSLTTMTHPEYGGRGIFKTLSLDLYNDLENKLGCKAIWGYPNNNSHFGFINSLGWSNIAVIHTMGISADKILKNVIPLNILSFDRFTDAHETYINSKLNNQFNVYIERSKDYLNWRYVEKPAVVYKKYEISNDGKKGIIVTKVYPSLTKDVFDLNIVECYLDDYTLLHNYIYFIMKDYQLQFSRITIWKSLFDKEHLQLEKNGFVPVVPQTYLGARIHSTMPTCFSNIQNWYIAMGDSDVF